MEIKMNEIKKAIAASTDLRRKIAKTFGVSLATVSLALNYAPQGDSERAARIRKYALLKGGVEEMTAPSSSVISVDGNVGMIQVFQNGCSWEWNRVSNVLTVFDKYGEATKKICQPSLNDIMDVQRELKQACKEAM